MSDHTPLVVINLIVKNESHCIVRCLDSTLKVLRECYGTDFEICLAVVDTMSDDNTVSVIRDWMKKYNVSGGVIRRPWLLFDGSRNESYRYAEWVAAETLRLRKAGGGGTKKKLTDAQRLAGYDEYNRGKRRAEFTKTDFSSIYINGADLFSMGVKGHRNDGRDFASYELSRYDPKLFDTRTYICVMDADNTLLVSKPNPTVTPLAADKRFTADQYLGTYIEAHDRTITRGLLFKLNPTRRWIWVYRIHECCIPEFSGAEYVQLTDFHVNSTREGGRSFDAAKYLRDATECVSGLAESVTEADKIRYTYYAGQCFESAGLSEEAIRYYKKRCEFKDGYKDEKYASAYAAGRLAGGGWRSIKFYERALSFMPYRYEAARRLLLEYTALGMGQAAYERVRYLVHYKHHGDLWKEHKCVAVHFFAAFYLHVYNIVGAYWENTEKCILMNEEAIVACRRILDNPNTHLVEEYDRVSAQNAIDVYFQPSIDKMRAELASKATVH